ncbi:unnamed protein product, partial [Prorocentrum cordatum]
VLEGFSWHLPPANRPPDLDPDIRTWLFGDRDEQTRVLRREVQSLREQLGRRETGWAGEQPGSLAYGRGPAAAVADAPPMWQPSAHAPGYGPLPQAMPHAMPHAMPQLMPQAVPQTMPQMMPQVMPPMMPQVLPLGAADPMQAELQRGIVQQMQQMQQVLQSQLMDSLGTGGSRQQKEKEEEQRQEHEARILELEAQSERRQLELEARLKEAVQEAEAARRAIEAEQRERERVERDRADADVPTNVAWTVDTSDWPQPEAEEAEAVGSPAKAWETGRQRMLWSQRQAQLASAGPRRSAPASPPPSASVADVAAAAAARAPPSRLSQLASPRSPASPPRAGPRGPAMVLPLTASQGEYSTWVVRTEPPRPPPRRGASFAGTLPEAPRPASAA